MRQTLLISALVFGLLTLVVMSKWNQPEKKRPGVTVHKSFDGDRLSYVKIAKTDINTVRWYTDEPNWCVVHTTDGKHYAVDQPGKECLDHWIDKDVVWMELKIKGDGIDPYAPNCISK